MKKRLELLGIVSLGTVIIWLLVANKQDPRGVDLKAPERTLKTAQTVPLDHATGVETKFGTTASLEGLVVTLKSRPISEVTEYLKEWARKDGDGLFKALMEVGQFPEAEKRVCFPRLAEALVLWPEAEGRFVFPVADAYSMLDLVDAGRWATDFLKVTKREDLAVTSILGRMAGVSTKAAFEMISQLPEGPREKALQDATYHVPLTDLAVLVQLCHAADSGGASRFSAMLFQRLAQEKLTETAEWLKNNPEALSLPGAAVSVAEGLVIAGKGTEAIQWADALVDKEARAQAIARVYQRWAIADPENAIKDILAAYPDDLQLMRDVAKGAAEQHGGPATYWPTAIKLENISARTYAVSALVEPLIVHDGVGKVREMIASLPAGSTERLAAEMTLELELQKPQIAAVIANGAH